MDNERSNSTYKFNKKVKIAFFSFFRSSWQWHRIFSQFSFFPGRFKVLGDDKASYVGPFIQIFNIESFSLSLRFFYPPNHPFWTNLAGPYLGPSVFPGITAEWIRGCFLRFSLSGSWRKTISPFQTFYGGIKISKRNSSRSNIFSFPNEDAKCSREMHEWVIKLISQQLQE